MVDAKLERQTGAIWTRPFVLLCLAQFLGYAHHALLTPTLPLYLTQLGSSPFVVGIMLAAFSSSSVVVRPLLGYWADSWHKAGVLVLGCVFLAATVLLFLIPSIEVTFLANALRGVSWAGLNTAGYAILAAVVPADRRGEAGGFYSGIQSSPSILFPALALWIIGIASGDFTWVFLSSAAMALGAAALGFFALDRTRGETLKVLGDGAPPRLGIAAFFDRGVLLPASLLLSMNLPHAAVTSFIVLYTRELGIENLGWYFAVIGAVSLLGRPLLGRVSDQVGRGHAVAAGCLFEMLGVFLIVLASDLLLLMVAGVLYFLGAALGVATTLALAMERSDPRRRGRAMATFSVAFPLAAALGAIIAGGLISILGYKGMYLAQMALLAAALFIVLRNWSSLNADEPSP